MPPRRSSRSARASVEPAEPPPPPSNTTLAKRKRGQSTDPAEPSAPTKAPPRSRRASSVKSEPEKPGSSKGRNNSTRSRGSLKEISEDEEEEKEEEEDEEEKPRAKKKARPSVEDDDVIKGRSRRTPGGRKNVEEGGSKPGRSVAAAAAKTQAARRSTAATTTTRRLAKKVVEESDDEDDDDDKEVEEEVQPKKRGRAAAKKAAQPSSDDEEDDEDDSMEDKDDEDDSDEAPPPARRQTARQSRGGKQPSNAKRAGPRTRTLVTKIVDVDEEDSEEEDDDDDDNDNDDDSEEDPAPKRPTKAKARQNSTRRSSVASSSGGGGPKSKSKRATTSRKGKAKLPEVAEAEEENPTSAAASSANDDDDDDDEEQEEEGEEEEDHKPTLTPSSKSTPSAPPDGGDTDNSSEEEEPQSLLDSIPLSPRKRPGFGGLLPSRSLILENAADEENRAPKARLVIHKMALINFKSYAGRQEIGPFHKSFSSIVGPNGSGKSNTIDALLFVFGYRASKMRQGKLSELIHNSARWPNLQDCTVEVHFQEIIDLPGPDAFELVPGSKLVVARTAYKNNSSKYTINGKATTYTDVQTLLKGKGIDLDHNRFLILQGEVESIAQMKPKATESESEGLLEYLEDIIGTHQFKKPIEEALAEMDRLHEDRTEKINRLRHVEKEKNKLEEQKREAEEYLRLKNEHVRAQSKLWQFFLFLCFEAGKKCEVAIDKLEKELAEQTEQYKDDVEHVAQLQKDFEERQATYKTLQDLTKAAMREFADNEKKEVNLEERKKHASGKLKKLKKSIQEDQHAHAEATRAIKDNADKMKREKSNLEQHEASLEREEKVLEGIRDSLKDKTQVFHDQIEVKQSELAPWTAKINVKQSEVSNATSERDALAKRAAAVVEASKEAEEELRNLREDVQTKEQEIQELRQTKAGLKSERDGAERTMKDLQTRVQQLKGKASSSRQKVDEARATQQQSTSQNKVLDSLTRLKSAGRVEGFHGRLGSLGTIPEKYDVAITTACGSLGNLVVDTVEQGQTCIEYLRSQNVGRASFMVLDKLGRQDMSKRQTPENAPRLFDLITPKEERFRPAFYKAIRDTLVADNLEQANRIAFGSSTRWRVVTLQGQLIDSSGTMSGGGNHVQRGGMSAKLQAESVSPQVLRQFEKESDDAAKMLEEATQQMRAAEAEFERLETAGPQIDVNLQKLDMAIRNGRARIADAEKRVRDLKSQSKPDAGDVARIKVLDTIIEKAAGELEQLQGRTAEIEQAIKDLEKKILDIGGSRLLAQKSKVDGLRLHINLANDEITKAEVAKAKAEKDSAKFAAAVETNEAALEGAQEEVDSLTEELEKVKAVVAKIRNTVEEAQLKEENSKEDLDALKAVLDEKTEAIEEFRKIENEIKLNLEVKRKEEKENGRQIEHWQAKHDELKLDDIDADDEEEDENESKADAEATPDAEVQEDVKPNIADNNSKPRDANELPMYRPDQLRQFKRQELIAHEQILDEKVKGTNPDLEVLKEYKKREAEFLRRAEDLEKITKLRDEQKQKYDDLRKQRLEEFMSGFNLISLKLKEMYQMITLGGNAELELVDSMDPFSEGIIFSVMPPKKSWKNISNLSGGEKTLSSLALVFALHVFKPTPLYFMDEIDAALDFRNVSIVANYIKDRTKNAQFIIISLRNDMFELSHRLIGIYKTNNATHSISIDNHLLHGAKAPPQTAV